MRGGRSEDTSGGRDGKRLGQREGRGTKNGGGGRREARSHSVPRSSQHKILTDRAQQRAPPTASCGAARGGEGPIYMGGRGPGPRAGVSHICIKTDTLWPTTRSTGWITTKHAADPLWVFRDVRNSPFPRDPPSHDPRPWSSRRTHVSAHTSTRVRPCKST